MTPPTLRNALRELARGRQDLEGAWITEVLRGKFGKMFQQVVEEAYLSGERGFEEYVQTMKQLALHMQFGDNLHIMNEDVAASLRKALLGGDRLEQIQAALVTMWLAYSRGGVVKPRPDVSELQKHFQPCFEGLVSMLNREDMPSKLTAAWALAWIGENRLLLELPTKDSILSLYEAWRGSKFKEQARFIAWGLSAQQLLDRDTFTTDVWGDCDAELKSALELSKKWDHSRQIELCALVVGWYRRSPWTDAELISILGKHADKQAKVNMTVLDLLDNLGEAGQRLATTLKEKERGLQSEQRKR